MQRQVHNIVFTLNNYTEKDIEDINNLDVQYLIYGKEVGESGTPHLQGYIELHKKMSFNKVAKLFKWHIEPRKGTQQQAIDYCKKEGRTFEKGEPKAQGKRHDLIQVKEKLAKGETTVDQITLEDPELFHQYGRTLNTIEDILLRKQFRTEMTTCDWIVGKTGKGKSHLAFQGYSPDTHYVLVNDNGWWEGYRQQPIVIINDFRGWILYNELLQLIDKWPHKVKRRNREPMPFTSKHIIITSVLEPTAVYNNRNSEDGIEQLLRRIKIIRL